jgi:hypothetical protein
LSSLFKENFLIFIPCTLTFSTLLDPNPAGDGMISEPVAVENNVAEGEVTNSTVDGTSIENNATAAVEPPVQMTKEEPRKISVAAPPPPAQKDVTKKSYASIVSSLFSLLSTSLLLPCLKHISE